MNKAECTDRLNTALELLGLLECTVESCSRRSENGQAVPWKGIQLVVAQGRQEIEAARQSLEEVKESGEAGNTAAAAPRNGSGASLADRVQRVSTLTGRVRELGSNGGSVSDHYPAEKRGRNAAADSHTEGR